MTSSRAIPFGIGRGDFHLDAFGGGFTDQDAVVAAHVVDDRLVEAVAADTHRGGVDDAVQRHDRDLGGAAADVQHHRTLRLVDRHAGADRGRHGLLDQVNLARAGAERRFADRAALDLGGTAGHADQHARARANELVFVHLANEVLQHFLGVGEIGDHAVLHRPDGGDVARRTAQHFLGIGTDRLDRLGTTRPAILANRDHRGFVQHDALAAQ